MYSSAVLPRENFKTACERRTANLTSNLSSMSNRHESAEANIHGSHLRKAARDTQSILIYTCHWQRVSGAKAHIFKQLSLAGTANVPHSSTINIPRLGAWSAPAGFTPRCMWLAPPWLKCDICCRIANTKAPQTTSKISVARRWKNPALKQSNTCPDIQGQPKK